METKAITQDKRPLTAVLFLLRLVSGIVGGIGGTLALFIVYFILLNVIPDTDQVTSLSLFVIVVMTAPIPAVFPSTPLSRRSGLI